MVGHCENWKWQKFKHPLCLTSSLCERSKYLKTNDPEFAFSDHNKKSKITSICFIKGKTRSWVLTLLNCFWMFSEIQHFSSLTQNCLSFSFVNMILQETAPSIFKHPRLQGGGMAGGETTIPQIFFGNIPSSTVEHIPLTAHKWTWWQRQNFSL